MSLPLETLRTIVTAVGALSCLGAATHLASVLWLFARPSSIHRYLNTKDGKPAWALVTGASGGIGGQLAHELALLGFNVVLHGRNQEKLDATSRRLAEAHPDRQFRSIIIDASQAFTAAETSSSWVATLQDINLTVLINNAGGTTERKMAPVDGLTAERLITDVSVNSIFPMLLIHQVIPLLEKNPNGLIINIGSLADLGVPLGGSYPASKAFLATMTEVLSREMRLLGRNIEVLAIRVGNVHGTNNSGFEEKDLFSPDAPSMAKAVIARVGCGRHVVVGHWRHALQFEIVNCLPKFVVDHFLTNVTSGFKDNKSGKDE
ncbi:short chain dehydrogenase/reductase [Plectosphaerella plurivora]|uniref:Short chain dehydrogenase/reductase n=1 Tax=Plectosphaerella plurivora TaxID=936078 RepID=A0A9P8VJ98_9PEZI|nr:short chain dehydrogenase/reductase [Plectosphaerella plurivora]